MIEIDTSQLISIRLFRNKKKPACCRHFNEKSIFAMRQVNEDVV